jgi:hypothetical protein
MLPLHFGFRLDVSVQSESELWLRGKLSWADGGADQALNWQSVSSGREVKMVLKPLSCYPGCTVQGVSSRQDDGRN